MLSFILVGGCSNKTGNEAEILLLDTKQNFILLRLLESKKVVDDDIRQSFELGFTRKLLLIGSASLDIDNLKGNELSGLCYLITYSTQTQLGGAAMKDAALASMAVEYARSIEKEVMRRIKKLQATLGGKDCNIG